VLAFASAAGLTTAAAAEDLPDDAFGWMDDLAGHCWSAVHPDGTRDTQCYATQFDRYLRGTIEIVAPPAAGGHPPYRGDSVFIWNPARSEIIFHYWSSAGSNGVITGRVEGDRLIFPDLSRSGEAPRTRTVWTRIDADRFRVVQQRLDGETWADGMSLVYARDAAGR
jgi:hypothetical protein